MIVLAAAVIAALGTAGWFVLENTGDRLLRSRRTRKVIVTLVSGETFEGVIAGCDRHSVVLSRASLLGDEKPKPVDGELLFPRSDVKFVQRP